MPENVTSHINSKDMLIPTQVLKPGFYISCCQMTPHVTESLAESLFSLCWSSLFIFKIQALIPPFFPQEQDITVPPL